MSKRKYDDVLSDEKTWTSHQPTRCSIVKNSLDSEEEDDEANDDNYNILDEDEIEGTEDGPTSADTNVGFTAFNMKEELEEGHFDKEGHYLWNKEEEIRDNWLDNIDWVKVKPQSNDTDGNKASQTDNKGLGDSDSDGENDNKTDTVFDPRQMYANILDYLQPNETVSKALCRLGKGKKPISSVERWKRKKAGLSEIDENSEKIIKLTELANELLTRTGNMDIYQESYDIIKRKINLSNRQSQETVLDMYADDFDVREKNQLDKSELNAPSESSVGAHVGNTNANTKIEEKTMCNSDVKPCEDTTRETITWELKWSQNTCAEITGPHTTEQMLAWAKEGYFKNGAWVRRTGQSGSFYTASRIDFELYI